MRSVRKGSDKGKIIQPSRKVVYSKRTLKPNNSIGNSLLRKLEPTLPLPRKSAKFKSPYKSPQIKLATENEKGQANSTTLPKEDSEKSTQNRSIQDISKNSKVQESLPKMSPVRIQPIDPYKFCETILKGGSGKNITTNKDFAFKRSREEQRIGNQEVLALIKRTAEAIKMIRTQHEEWKNNQQRRDEKFTL